MEQELASYRPYRLIPQIGLMMTGGADEAHHPEQHYLPYYPGDDYVDWWAIDLFSADNFTADNTLAFMADARRHGFSVMIGESTPRWAGGVEAGETTWQRWFVPYFQFIRSEPTVKAFCYISWDWTEYPVWRDWGDARIWINGPILDRYQRELRDPFYQHALLQPAL